MSKLSFLFLTTILFMPIVHIAAQSQDEANKKSNRRI